MVALHTKRRTDLGGKSHIDRPVPKEGPGLGHFRTGRRRTRMRDPSYCICGLTVLS
jgi:hypothetical protein